MMARFFHVLVTGGTGLIGKRIIAALLSDGHEVTVLSRKPNHASNNPRLAYMRWNGASIPDSIENVDAVLNMAGAGIADKRWTAAYKREIFESRIMATEACVAFIQNADTKPKVFLSSSAVGYYSADAKVPMDETSPVGTGFLADTCLRWEKAAEGSGVRTVLLRTGLVMAPEGGAFPRLLTPFKYYAGAYLGSGKQPFPWIHIEDEVGVIQFLLKHPTVAGPANLVAPDLQTNKGFAKLVGLAINTKVLMGIPEFVVKAMMGERATLLLEGQMVKPRKLQELGYEFKFPTAKSAIQHIIANKPVHTKFTPGRV